MAQRFVLASLLIAVAFVATTTSGRAQGTSGQSNGAIGELQRQIDNLKARLDAAKSDGPCFDNANRYVDCGNGTVTDTVTGLIWLKQADCLANNDWAAANGAAAGLKDGDCGLTDGSSPGDWRLSTKDEWIATVARAVAMGCKQGGQGPPSLTNDAGTACYGTGAGSSFAGVAATYYWSSTTYEVLPNRALHIGLGSGMVDHFDFTKDVALRVWPVRGGLR